jgi:predicted dehydrogenase
MPLKLAIIGTGKVAREQYIPFLAGQRDAEGERDVELGYWNRTAETARAITQKYPGEVFATLQEAADWKPDSALILTAETARFEISRKLILAGIPKIFFEKPLVAAGGQAHVTEADFHRGKELLTLAKERHCETAMVFNYRFFDLTLAAKKAAAGRDFGRVTTITALVHFACWSHVIDLIRHFAGDIAEVTALAGTTVHSSPELQIQASDVAAAFGTAGGATGTIVGTLAMQWQHPLYELTLTFERGRIHLRDLDGTLEILAAPASPAPPATHECISLSRHTSRWHPYDESFKKALAAYLHSLRTATPPPVPGMEGLRELQFEAALKRSIAQHRPVRIDEEFPCE